MVTRVTGINAVTNSEGYMIREGSDPESDEQLRQRAIGVWETLGLGGTREASHTYVSVNVEYTFDIERANLL